MTDPNELKKYYDLKVKIEMICEPGDLKRITDLLKELSKKRRGHRTKAPLGW